MSDLVSSLLLAAVLGLAAAFSGWRGSRPWDPLRGPRLLPWRLVMLTLGFGAVLALVHAANLAGVATGRADPR